MAVGGVSAETNIFQRLLLSDGAVPVKPLALKEAVTYHAVAK
jgi:hypothetical protein